MHRRKTRKQLEAEAGTSRKTRIAKLLAAGWIRAESEIPSDAFPVDPDLINLGGSYDRPIFYRDREFTCVDCGKGQRWKVSDQLWYYETTGAPFYSNAIRCRPCRKQQAERNQQARIASGHAKAKGKASAR